MKEALSKDKLVSDLELKQAQVDADQLSVRSKIAKEQLEKITKAKVKQYAKQQIKEQATQLVEEKVVGAAKDKAKEAAVGMAQNTGRQSIETYFDARSGIDLEETAGVAGTAAGEYVDGLKNEVTGGEGSTVADYTDLNSHVDNAVGTATERVSGAVGDRVQRGAGTLAGHGAHATQASPRAAAGASAAPSGSAHAMGNVRDWARSEFG